MRVWRSISGYNPNYQERPLDVHHQNKAADKSSLERNQVYLQVRNEGSSMHLVTAFRVRCLNRKGEEDNGNPKIFKQRTSSTGLFIESLLVKIS